MSFELSAADLGGLTTILDVFQSLRNHATSGSGGRGHDGYQGPERQEVAQRCRSAAERMLALAEKLDSETVSGAAS